MNEYLANTLRSDLSLSGDHTIANLVWATILDRGLSLGSGSIKDVADEIRDHCDMWWEMYLGPLADEIERIVTR